ncbi:hypothetical protein SCHPADRAFT_893920 [Schizopora paradoxa]|uniref:BTB domain-containing protein n=1 Tax=Schizopora paradoxa TaxID=27342 RepID=A0A0H2RAK0_9AGAM|nr:hypothetical protein SCHPADRAFT_893920 [Schizopora paradoxa]
MQEGRCNLKLNVEDIDGEHENAPTMAPKPHESLWFPGGDIVLSTNTYLFKVHKDLLALQSSVFRDMFQIPAIDVDADNEQPVEDNGVGITADLYEGLPLVALAGDEGKDVAHLLQAVYYREYYYRDNDKTPIETIISLLLLSNKYDFRHIRNEVTQQLSRLYPKTLAAFDHVDEDGYSDDLFGMSRVYSDYRLLKACHLADIIFLLPRLFYACSGFEVHWIYEEVDEAGGLDPSCLRTLLTGKSKLDLALRAFIASLPDEFRSISCPTCKVGAYVSRLHQQEGSHLSAYKGHALAQSVLNNGCQLCTTEFANRIEDKREEIWEQIPSYYGFPEWEELLERFDETKIQSVLAFDCRVQSSFAWLTARTPRMPAREADAVVGRC